MLRSAGGGNEVGGDGQDKSSGQDGTGRSWSVPSQLLLATLSSRTCRSPSVTAHGTFQPPPAEAALSMAVSSLPVPATVNHTPEQRLRESI